MENKPDLLVEWKVPNQPSGVVATGRYFNSTQDHPATIIVAGGEYIYVPKENIRAVVNFINLVRGE